MVGLKEPMNYHYGCVGIGNGASNAPKLVGVGKLPTYALFCSNSDFGGVAYLKLQPVISLRSCPCCRPLTVPETAEWLWLLAVGWVAGCWAD